MNIYAGLLFNQGYVSDPELARSLARMPRPAPGSAAPPTTGAGAAGPDDPGRLRRGARRRGWVELRAALLSVLR